MDLSSQYSISFCCENKSDIIKGTIGKSCNLALIVLECYTIHLAFFMNRFLSAERKLAADPFRDSISLLSISLFAPAGWCWESRYARMASQKVKRDLSWSPAVSPSDPR